MEGKQYLTAQEAAAVLSISAPTFMPTSVAA